MPLFIDIHSITIDLTAAEVAAIHGAGDEQTPGSRCLRHWVSSSTDRLFCLVEADESELARRVHGSSSALVIDECHPVAEYM